MAGKKRNNLRVDRRTARLLDANCNRAREGLRVLEDAARFLWNDQRLYKVARTLRHGVHALTESRYRDLLKARESVRDIGRTLPEAPRGSIGGVVSANIRRAQEAVRVLEEYSKVFSPRASSGFKAIRYRIYQTEKEILKYL